MTSLPLNKVLFPLSPGADDALRGLEARNDRTARTIKRLFALPDLTRTVNSPVKIIVDAILNLDRFKTFDLIEIPEVVSVRENFDLLNTPSDHPARSPSDTYYLSGNTADGWLLRTQTTTMWPYYLGSPEVRAKLQEQGTLSAVCHGRVFRNDEVDRTHYPCFHQIDGLHIVHRRHGLIQKDDLIDVLVGIARAVYGSDVETQVTEDRFPFTDPSVELAVKLRDRWLEILGAGCVHPQVLRNFNLDPAEYSGWAFGFGIDRLAMVKMEIPDIRVLWSEDPRIKSQFTGLDSRYQPVSNYPSTFRDITFVIPKALSLNRFFEVVREEGIVSGEDAIEEVTLVDQYENDAKFGADNKSYSFRIVYRSNSRTLTNSEVNETQDRIRSAVERELGATLR
jgi:phenylalanyl-tRNA synthetase alpha chain